MKNLISMIIFIMVLLVCSNVFAKDVTVSWDNNTDMESDISDNITSTEVPADINLDWDGNTLNAIETDRVIIYVGGKHGNDSNDGLTPNTAKLTFSAAITYAITQTPSSSNRFSINYISSQ